jgi:uncharacterized protein
MTPQERDLITQLLGRLGQAGGQPKDPEADALIRQAVAAQPDAPYYLVQTVLIQDMALSNAQSRIHELEQQLAAAKPAPAQPTSFLGGLFGGRAVPAAGSAGAPPAGPSPAGPPPAGPWSRPAPGPQQYAQPQYAPQPQYQGQPMVGQPMMGGAMPMMASSGSGFRRSAAATAAGIAGGALLFEGIQSMFGSHAGGILSGATMQPGLSETVINNYYGSDPASGTGAAQTAASEPPAGSDPADYAADDSGDPGQDLASDQDFSDGDFGGDSDTV